MNTTSTILTLLILSCCSPLLYGQEIKPGMRVVIVNEEEILDIDNQSIDGSWVWPGQIVMVRQVRYDATWKADQVLIESIQRHQFLPQVTKGWISKSIVVPYGPDAIEKIDAFVKVMPNHFQARIGRGIVWAELGDTDQALKDLNQVEADGKDSVELTTFFFKLRANLWQRSGDDTKAEQDLEHGLRLDAESVAVQVTCGNGFFDLGKVDRALQCYNEAIRLDPTFALAYYSRALVWDANGDKQKAIEDYSHAIHLDPNDCYPYVNRGLARTQLGEFKSAISDFSRSIELNPQLAVAFYGRALNHYNLNQYDNAIQDFTRSIELNPSDAEAFMNRGYAWKIKKQYDKALSDLDKAIQLNPQLAEAYLKRGIVHGTQGETAKSMEDLDQAIELDASLLEAYKIRGFLHEKAKQYVKAVESYAKIAVLDPTDHRTIARLAGILAATPDEQIVDGERAVKFARSACEQTQWKEGFYILVLAISYAAANDFEKATEYLDQVPEEILKRSPEDSSAIRSAIKNQKRYIDSDLK